MIDSADVLTEEIFGTKARDLYTKTGATPFDRKTLPKSAQEAYYIAETRAAEDLSKAEMGSSPNSPNRDFEIVDTVEESAKKTRKLFPW